MKAEIYDNRIMVVPETDFERDWLFSHYQQGFTFAAFVKTGAHIGDPLGLLINRVPVKTEGEI